MTPTAIANDTMTPAPEAHGETVFPPLLALALALAIEDMPDCWLVPQGGNFISYRLTRKVHGNLDHSC
jgi:hypothetical protein